MATGNPDYENWAKKKSIRGWGTARTQKWTVLGGEKRKRGIPTIHVGELPQRKMTGRLLLSKATREKKVKKTPFTGN